MAQVGQLLMHTFRPETKQKLAEDKWQGDDLSTDKHTHATRIMFHNVNGLSTSGIKGIDIFAQEQVTVQIDIQCFSEHCLDTTKFQVQNCIHDSLKRNFSGQYVLQLQSSEETALNVYKPGGTGILALGKITGRQEPNGKGGDPLGRWSYLHLRRQNSAPVTIISAYQVCMRPTNVLGNTAYHQQIRALHAQGRHSIHPRKAFIQDLTCFITELQKRGHDIILGGDFNESLDAKNSGILKLITTTNLTDPFLYRFPHHIEFGTHNLGTRRIDAVFISPSLLSSVSCIGYSPFQYGTTSDHRSIVVEFRNSRLFGQATNPFISLPSRQVRSNDRKSVTNFINKWYEEITKSRGFDFQRILDNDTASPNVLEVVDEIIGKSSDKAEKACQRRRPEFYSQQIVQQRLRVSILRGHLNSLRLGKDRSRQLHQRMERLGLAFPLPLTIRDTTRDLEQAHRDLHETSKNHAQVRQEELQEKIDEASQNRQKTKARILRAIKKVENNQKTYRILQAMKRKTQPTSTLDRVEIPDSWPPREQAITSMTTLEDPKTCTNWKLVTNPRDIEYYLMLRNRLHFGQAQGTPFTVNPLRQDFDWTASTQEADQLLQGEYSYGHSTPNCIDLLQACKANAELDNIPPELTRQEFQGKIQSWRESTTTSPSGRHLGRYKALFSSGYKESSGLEEDEEGPGKITLAAQQESITSLILSVINYCIRNSYVLDRWKKIVNVMIFKEPDNYKIHRLRVIHIYEADFNLILAVKWRKLLRTADAKHLLNDGQYGGRPGCEAQSLTLLEELKYDLSYLTRRTLFNFDNDATSCYDRIVVSLASIVNRKYGMHRKIVAIHAATLQQAKFHLKTASGVSATHYTPSERFPIFGTGQGSGNSPSIWLFISSTLFDVHNSLANGVTFVSPDEKQKVHFSMVGFVDDSTGTCNDFKPQHEAPLSELMRRMESDAQIWSNLLYCTGGKLELPKCSFHVLRFHFRANGTPVPVIDAYDNHIRVTDLETAEQIQIPSKRAFDPHKTLGHYKSPYSRQNKELQTLKQKADRISLLITISPITRQGAYLAYNSVYLPSIAYVLPQSFFPRKTLEKAQAQSIHRMIAKCGYNRHTARSLIYAPHEYAGGGFLPWHLLQGEGQIKHFIKHWRTDTIVSKTLRVALAWAQWQAGHETSILEDTSTSIPYLECRWLQSLRSFLNDINAAIMVDTEMVTTKEKHNDLFIMTLARDSGLFNPRELAIINYCRLYLHITTISELFDAAGKQIVPDLFACNREPWFNPETIVSLQARPSNYQIQNQWQKLCRQFTTANGHLAESIDIGKWTIPGHQLRRRRQTYMALSDNIIYHWKIDCYWEYRAVPTKQCRFAPIRPSTWLPTSRCTPITVEETHQGCLVVKRPRGNCTLDTSRRSNVVSFSQYIRTLPMWEQRLLEGVRLYYQPYEILCLVNMATENTRFLLVSDGSQRVDEMTYGWVFGSDSEVILAEHAGNGLGECTSHRAEGWGMLSGIVFVNRLITYTHAANDQCTRLPTLSLVSDNQGLVTRVNQRLTYDNPFPNSTLAPDWDVIEQIVTTIRENKRMLIEVSWVKGHQDEEDSELTVEATYNIRADALAGEYSPDKSQLINNVAFLPAARCQLLIRNIPIQGHYAKHIRDAYTQPAYYGYLEQRYGWTKCQIQRIDWQAFRRAACNIPIDQVQLLKLVYDKLPTNYELAKVDRHQPPQCHYCTERETFHHLLTCTNPTSTEFREVMSKAVAEYLSYHDIPESLALAISQSIQQSLGIQHASDTPINDFGSAKCCTDQTHYGHKILQGFLHIQWRVTYERLSYRYGIQHSQSSIDVFAGLIKLLWQQQLTFWGTHLSKFKSPTTACPTSVYDKMTTYRARVRELYQQRDNCLPGHRDQYFHQDLETFVTRATCSQLKHYLHHYEPAILASVKTARQQPTRTIFTFPGFTRMLRNQSSRLRTPTNISNVQDIYLPKQWRNHNSHASPSAAHGGIPINRKHTRWRTPQNPLQSLRNFFSPLPG